MDRYEQAIPSPSSPVFNNPETMWITGRTVNAGELFVPRKTAWRLDSL
jgi:hypothetical protein